MHRRVIAVFGALLTLYCTPPATRPTQAQTLHCGIRPPGGYAVILDVSSSVARTRRELEATKSKYAGFLSLLSGWLCGGDSLYVYTFSTTDFLRLRARDTLSGSRTQAEIRRGV